MKLYRTKFIAAAMGVVLHLMGSVACAQGDGSANPLADPKNPPAKRSIFFDYDSTAIRDVYRETIKANATYLSSEGSRRVVIQGNAELHGTRETSLALGGLRAEAVRAALLALGVSPGKMEAVSLGQEKPRALGRDPQSSAENRRVDLVYH
jgi:peptidoglycan-associated lipoprotein